MVLYVESHNHQGFILYTLWQEIFKNTISDRLIVSNHFYYSSFDLK